MLKVFNSKLVDSDELNDLKQVFFRTNHASIDRTGGEISSLVNNALHLANRYNNFTCGFRYDDFEIKDCKVRNGKLSGNIVFACYHSAKSDSVQEFDKVMKATRSKMESIIKNSSADCNFKRVSFKFTSNQLFITASFDF